MPAYDSWDAESARGTGFDSEHIDARSPSSARDSEHTEGSERSQNSDPAVVMRMGFELALLLLGDVPSGAASALRSLEDAAATWARDRIPIDMVQHAIHDGVELTLNRIDPAGGTGTTDPVGRSELPGRHARSADRHRIPGLRRGDPRASGALTPVAGDCQPVVVYVRAMRALRRCQSPLGWVGSKLVSWVMRLSR